MGFFASELYAILERRAEHPQVGTPWTILSRLGIHPQQVDRLRKANDELGLIATLPAALISKVQNELELTKEEYARLMAAMEADVFLRLLLYHQYPLEEAANRANSIFAAALKDLLAAQGNPPILPLGDAAEEYPPRRRSRAARQAILHEDQVM